jgi:hypothetical protein
MKTPYADTGDEDECSIGANEPAYEDNTELKRTAIRWIRGKQVVWHREGVSGDLRKISLPTYPFRLT